MNIAENLVVGMEYTLTDPDGEVLDTSEGRGPMAYLHGKGGIIPGLEEALTGKAVGDELKIVVPPEKAYGPRHEQMLNRVPKESFGDKLEFELGLQFPVQDQQGNTRMVTIVHIEDDSVILDANHPLAGIELTFDVKIIEVREPTPEELAQSQKPPAEGDQAS